MAMTIRVKRTAAPEAEAVEETLATETEATGEAQAPGAPVLSAYDVPVKKESYTIAAIAGLLASLLFVALVLMQWMEMNYYQQPPTAFPLVGTGVIAAPAPAAAPAAAPAPAAEIAPAASSEKEAAPAAKEEAPAAATKDDAAKPAEPAAAPAPEVP